MNNLTDPLLKEFSSNFTPEHMQDVLGILLHLEENISKIKRRLFLQLLMAMDVENVQTYIKVNNRHPSNIGELFIFWQEQGYTTYFAILEFSIQDNHGAPSLEQFCDIMTDPRHHP